MEDMSANSFSPKHSQECISQWCGTAIHHAFVIAIVICAAMCPT
jgi:hypothetical protein